MPFGELNLVVDQRKRDSAGEERKINIRQHVRGIRYEKLGEVWKVPLALRRD